METDLKNKVKHKAGVVVYRTGDSGNVEVLLVSSRKHEDSWVFPVGTVEDHETLQVAAARECEEESGYKVETEDEIGTVQIKDKRQINYYTFYKATVTGEAEEYEIDRERIWVSIDELKNNIAEIFLPIALSFEKSLN